MNINLLVFVKLSQSLNPLKKIELKSFLEHKQELGKKK